MNAAHLHIVLNHIPVIGVPFGAVLLILGLLRKSEEVKRASLLTFVVIALITIPTYLAGKGAEDIGERLPGVAHDLIENHEDAALIALVFTSVLGALSLLGLGWSLATGRLALPSTVLLLLISLGVAGWLGRTANLGGKSGIPSSEMAPLPRMTTAKKKRAMETAGATGAGAVAGAIVDDRLSRLRESGHASRMSDVALPHRRRVLFSRRSAGSFRRPQP